MSQATDFTIANQSFPSFRSDLNTVLGAINTSNSGSSRPSSAVSGTFWLDTTTATAPILKFFDGSDDITFATFNTTANTVNVSDSATSLSGDTSPQLGGNLDVVTHSIVSTSNRDINITPNGTGRTVFGTAVQPKTYDDTFVNLTSACAAKITSDGFFEIIILSPAAKYRFAIEVPFCAVCITTSLSVEPEL